MNLKPLLRETSSPTNLTPVMQTKEYGKPQKNVKIVTTSHATMHPLIRMKRGPNHVIPTKSLKKTQIDTVSAEMAPKLTFKFDLNQKLEIDLEKVPASQINNLTDNPDAPSTTSPTKTPTEPQIVNVTTNRV